MNQSKEIGFGTWAWGNKLLWGYDSKEQDEILEYTFKEAISGGLTFIDTADSYGIGQLNGQSEVLLGGFMKNLSNKDRSKITIATKLAPYPWRLGRNGFKKAFLKSQSRLQGYLNRIQLHWSTSKYAPKQEEDLLDGLGDIFESGSIQEIGVSNIGPNRLEWMHNRLKSRGIPLKSVQIQFSLLSAEEEKTEKLKLVCKKLNIDLIAYSPLGLGVLTVKPEESPHPSTYLRRAIYRNVLPGSLSIRMELNKIANKRGVTQEQVALNWCRANGTIPIPGLRSPSQANQAIKALGWELNQSEKLTLNRLKKECKVRLPSNPFQSN